MPMRSDEQIRRDRAALLAEELPGVPVTIAVADGAVRLRFTRTPEASDRRIAELLASTVPGVLSFTFARYPASIAVPCSARLCRSVD